MQIVAVIFLKFPRYFHSSIKGRLTSLLLRRFRSMAALTPPPSLPGKASPKSAPPRKHSSPEPPSSAAFRQSLTWPKPLV